MAEKKGQSDNVLTEYARKAVKQELERKKALKLPISEFDPKTGSIYIIDGDGNKEEVDNINRDEGSSERVKEET